MHYDAGNGDAFLLRSWGDGVLSFAQSHSDALDHGRVEALWMMLYITYLIRSRKGYDSCIRILTQRPALRQLRLTHTVRPMHYFVHHHHHFICMHWAEELDDVKMFQQVLIFVIDTKYSYCLTASRFAHKCHAMRLHTGGFVKHGATP